MKGWRMGAGRPARATNHMAGAIPGEPRVKDDKDVTDQDIAEKPFDCMGRFKQQPDSSTDWKQEPVRWTWHSILLSL